ncbi:MAG: ATP-binding cassette domain-containing protein [Ruminococcus sp.]|nr:ATP-binding cassette domain-containing protein [Ruminococcus sp.]
MEIVFDHVSKKIGKNLVIDDMSFKVDSHKITGLKGINGSGKTMVMRLISGLIYASSGTVSIDGKVLGKDIAFPQSLGLLLENPSFINKYTGYDNLRMLADIRSTINEERIQEVMRIVGLEENGKKKYKKFSLGMKQRLGIAAAIMERPQIILLDEPTNALDTDGVEMVKDIINTEKERGATVVISCHDSETLETLSDEIIEIQSGKITRQYMPKPKFEENNYVI